MEAHHLRIGIDLDGVVYPCVTILRRWLVEVKDWDPERCPPATSWGFYADWGMTEADFDREFTEAIEADFMFTEGDPRAGALEALHRFTEQGHHLYVITARQIEGVELEARRQTFRWLAQHDIALSGIAISHDKGVLPTDVFLEDAIHNYEFLENQEETLPVLLTRKWNQDHGGRRVADWDEFADVVEALHGFLCAAQDERGEFEVHARQPIIREAWETLMEPLSWPQEDMPEQSLSDGLEGT